MLVFIRNIPVDTLTKELNDFISPALKGGLFKTKGQITEKKFLFLKDTNTKNTECHAVVTIEPDKVAERAIKQLNGTKFRGKPTGVRQFYIRNKEENSTNYDRRRNLVEIDYFMPTYTGFDNLNRKLSS